ncbi:hypothetical protein A4A49_37711 [Nicotiana attenuata]|uniref:HMA domain-containing protein n=2 Tax=Nicotiana attenuata TaxID=49451 RepID=A0A1J6KF59_NICAT|nr:hypothetical protein A4A49_37711 [Nicotiana attenuata]
MEEEIEQNVSANFEIDMHCACKGCNSRVHKCIQDLQDNKGLKSSGISIEQKGTKFMVKLVGKLNPVKLQKKLKGKLKKRVELVAPEPNEEDGAAAEEKEESGRVEDNEAEQSTEQFRHIHSLPVSTYAFVHEDYHYDPSHLVPVRVENSLFVLFYCLGVLLVLCIVLN